MTWNSFNPAQKKVVLTSLVLIAVNCLFPPWCSRLDWQGKKRLVSKGYAAIFAPPDAGGYWSIGIDFQRLAVQLCAVIAITVVAVLFLGDRPRGGGPATPRPPVAEPPKTNAPDAR